MEVANDSPFGEGEVLRQQASNGDQPAATAAPTPSTAPAAAAPPVDAREKTLKRSRFDIAPDGSEQPTPQPLNEAPRFAGPRPGFGPPPGAFPGSGPPGGFPPPGSGPPWMGHPRPGMGPPPFRGGAPPRGPPPRGPPHMIGKGHLDAQAGYPPGAYGGGPRPGTFPPRPGFGGPPGGGPPMNQHDQLKQMLGLAPHEELWVETKTNENKSYYYNAATRETTWKMPTGNVRVMSQVQIEADVERAQSAGREQQNGAPPPQWMEYSTPDGRKYYYNAASGETTWERPREFVATQPAPSPAPVQQQMPAMESARPAATASPMGGGGGGGASGNRPVSSTPITGTPWCVVWTGDKKVFFYNPSTRTSVWERPPEMYGRGDVDALVREMPAPKAAAPVGLIAKDKPIGASDATTANNSKGSTADSESGSDSDSGDSDAASEHAEESDLSNRQKKKLRRAREDAVDAAKGQPVGKKAKIDAAEKLKMQQHQQAVTAANNRAMEQELQAQQQRAAIPMDVRVASFKEMLADKKVSAFSTWEKELSKIVFDERYLLLNSRERKLAFEDWVKNRAEIERAERKKKAKESREGFKTLLKESDLHAKSSYREFEKRHGKEERFKAVEKSKDREDFFDDFVDGIRTREKEEKAMKREKQKTDFLVLLGEQDGLYRNARWSEWRKKLGDEERYKDIESTTTKEDYFRAFIRNLSYPVKEEPEEGEADDDDDDDKKSSRKRRRHSKSPSDHHHHHSSKKSKHDREEKKKSKKDKKEKDKSEKGDDVAATDKPERGRDSEPPESGEIVGVPSDEGLDDEARARKVREERAKAEREKEVAASRANLDAVRSKGLEKQSRSEAELTYKQILTDLCKSLGPSYKETRRVLRKHDKYESCDVLDKPVKERLYDEHIKTLKRKRHDQLKGILGELPSITISTRWGDAKRLLRDDERVKKLYAHDERTLEKEYRDYIDESVDKAKYEFVDLLSETKLITYKSKEEINDNEQHLKDILAVLENDSRYLVLNAMPDERERLLDMHMKKLAERGAPPPVTATEPDRPPRRVINIVNE